MKRLFTSVLCIVLLMASCAAAEKNVFDPAILEALEGYTYDKFEKSWWYCGEYIEIYSDATATVRIETSGKQGVFDGVLIATFIRDEKNMETLGTVERLLILADDTLITCVLLDAGIASATYILPESEEVLKIIAQAKELSFKLDLGGTSLVMEPTKKQVKDFKDAAKILYENNVVDYTTFDDEFKEMIRDNWPITIE